ncbi:hypothetical protein [Nocardioides sp.]|uniref:hypothetical protein n=1 Tax=Nocardioides sp. TaxID=35761 RepID=UPI00352897D9
MVELADLLGDQGDASPARVRSAVPSSVVDAVVARSPGSPPPVGSWPRRWRCSTPHPPGSSATSPGSTSPRRPPRPTSSAGSGWSTRSRPCATATPCSGPGVLAASSPGAVTLMRRRAARLLADQPHAAAAQLLETEGQGDPWAVELLRSAAASSLAEGAPHTAVGLLRRAVAEPPSAEELPDTLVELGMAEMRTADAACVETLSRAESLLPSALDRARVAMALAEAFNYAGFHALAVEVLDRAYADVAGQDGELDLQVEAALIAASLLVPEHLADGRRRLAAHPDVPGSTPGERQLCQQLTYNAVATNQPAAVIREFAHRAIGPDDTPETTDWVWARLFLTAIGDFDDVRRLADHGLAQAAERNSVLGHVTASFVRAQADLWSGHLVAAEGHFRALLDHAANLGTGELAQTLGAAGMAQTLALQGRVAEAVATLEPYPQEMPAHSPGNGVAAMVFAHAVVGMATGDLDRVLRAGAQGEELARRLDVDSPTWAAWRAVVIEPLRLRGDLDSARARAVEHLALCERAGVPHLLGEALRLGGRVAADPEEGSSCCGARPRCSPGAARCCSRRPPRWPMARRCAGGSAVRGTRPPGRRPPPGARLRGRTAGGRGGHGAGRARHPGAAGPIGQRGDPHGQ